MASSLRFFSTTLADPVYHSTTLHRLGLLAEGTGVMATLEDRSKTTLGSVVPGKSNRTTGFVDPHLSLPRFLSTGSRRYG